MKPQGLTEWQKFRRLDRDTIEADILQSMKNNPSSLLVLRRVIEYLEFRRFQELNDVMWLQREGNLARGFCECLAQIADRFQRWTDRIEKELSDEPYG